MQPESQVHFSSTASDETRRVLFDLAESVTSHVAALQAAGRDLLMRRANAGMPVPTEIKFEIKVGPGGDQPTTDPLLRQSVECWDHTYACGKSESGYVMCTAHVCMIT